MSRAKCVLSSSVCEMLLKAHVNSLGDAVYKSDDPEVVVKHYLSFLCGCAKQTLRLNGGTVRAAAQAVFHVPPLVAKNLKATSGKKLSDPVKSVLLSFSSPPPAIGELQMTMKESQSSPGGSSSKCLPAAKSQCLVAGGSSSQCSVDSSQPPLPLGDVSTQAYADSPRRAILKVYGVSPPPKKARKTEQAEAMAVYSSQEVVDSQPSPGPVHPSERPLQKRASEEEAHIAIAYTRQYIYIYNICVHNVDGKYTCASP
jgi:hypothetical protein